MIISDEQQRDSAMHIYMYPFWPNPLPSRLPHNWAEFPVLSVQFSCSVVSDFSWPPWTATHQASLFITNSWSLLKLTSIELVMLSVTQILCTPVYSMTWFCSYKSESFGLISSYISDYKVFTMLLIYWKKGQFNRKKIIEINNIIYNILLVYLEKIDFTSPGQLLQA